MERSDSTIRHSSFDILHSKGGFSYYTSGTKHRLIRMRCFADEYKIKKWLCQLLEAIQKRILRSMVALSRKA